MPNQSLELTAEEFFAGGEPTDVFDRAIRSDKISRWKETYSEAQMVPYLCTQAEYDSIPTGTSRRDAHLSAAGAASLMSQQVGYEKELPDLDPIRDLYK